MASETPRTTVHADRLRALRELQRLTADGALDVQLLTHRRRTGAVPLSPAPPPATLEP
ncbi:hypothetical protein [Streptomyces koyangensis]|uniref:Uncharacterized protein n=1 Tax=Streptomyces koyangensis TaxID=188770 RepID=A0ABX7EGI1_9ACTN|nr:hypothetical protein [Streptomyces koyangensis]QRF03633.1 hypothetical protein G9U55_16565 [Streptomyces koyangensis]